MFTFNPQIFAMGLVVGLVSTVFGIGGGVIMIPALTALAGFPQLAAMATNTGAVFLVSCWNSWRYHRAGLVVWPVVGWIALGSGICSFLGATLAQHLPEKILVAGLLTVILGLAWKTFFLPEEKLDKKIRRRRPWLPVLVGAAGGTIAGLTGIGGGAVIMPLILIADLAKNRQAAPTSIAVIIFTTGAGTLSYLLSGPLAFPRFGLIRLDYVITIAAGAILSSYFGRRLNQKLPLKLRKTTLAILLLLIAGRLVIQLLG
jgi:uncharacterized membrane protein YfcA